MKRVSLVLAASYFLLAFSSIFVGNARMFGDYLLAPFVLFSLLVYALLNRENIALRRGSLYQRLALMVCTLLIFATDVLNSRPYDPYFWMWSVYAYLAGLLLVLIHTEIETDSKRMVLVALCTLAVFLVGASFNLDELGRAYFIFGPNVLYRVFIFCLAFVLFSRSSSFSIKIVVVLMAVYGVYLTGSRGGGVLLGILCAIYLSQYKKIFTGFLASTLVAIAGYAILSEPGGFEELGVHFGRFGSFESAGVDARIHFLTSFLSGIEPFGHSYLDFSRHYYYPEFQYPHNIFGELIYFYGLSGVFVSLMIFFVTFRVVRKIQRTHRANTLELGYIVTLVGAQFSGDLFDNAFILAYLVFSLYERTRSERLPRKPRPVSDAHAGSSELLKES